MSEILKGNYKVPNPVNTDKPAEDKPVSLEDEFEAAALRKLGGSITFVKKGFTWRGEKGGKDA